MERTNNKKNKYRVVSLFAGIGGFDLGFDFAGFNIVWANDFDKYAVKTYAANVNNSIICDDIRNVVNDIPFHDVLLGGFPCQPFSTLGKLQGFKDEERGTLFFVIKSIISKYTPKIIVLENVKNLINHDRGNTFSRILNELNQIGYRCYYKVLNTMDYGIPQRRNRVFIVGMRKEVFKESASFVFPEPLVLNNTTQDLLDNEVDVKYFLTKRLESTILGYGTKGYQVKPTIDLPISKTLCATMHKMHRASQDNYVTDETNYNRFNDDNRIPIRKLTPNECRKLQGFPSDWKQVVSDSQAYKQFGNAVTVDVAYYLARQVETVLNNGLIE